MNHRKSTPKHKSKVDSFFFFFLPFHLLKWVLPILCDNQTEIFYLKLDFFSFSMKLFVRLWSVSLRDSVIWESLMFLPFKMAVVVLASLTPLSSAEVLLNLYSALMSFPFGSSLSLTEISPRRDKKKLNEIPTHSFLLPIKIKCNKMTF